MHSTPSTRSLLFLPTLGALLTVLYSLDSYADTWGKTYGGPSADRGQSLCIAKDGGYVVSGTTASFGSGSADVLVLSLDRTGGTRWAKSYGGAQGETRATIAATHDGGFVFAATSSTFTTDTVSGGSAVWVSRLNSLGGIVWQKSYEGSGTDGANAIQQREDGLIVVAGHTSSFGSQTKPNAWIFVLDPAGAIAWQKAYGTNDTETLYDVRATSDGGYIAVGHIGSPATPDAWILKLTPNGTITWQRSLGGPGVEMAYSVREAKDGGFIVVGYTNSAGRGGTDGLVLKLSPSGAKEWAMTYGGPRDEFLRAAVETRDGGYIAAGSTQSFGAGEHDYWLVKLGPKGDVVWQKTFGGLGDDFGTAVQQTPNGEYVAAGTSGSFGAGADDVLLVKVTGQGNIVGCDGSTMACPALRDSSASPAAFSRALADSNASATNSSAAPRGTIGATLESPVAAGYAAQCSPAPADLVILSLDHCPLMPTSGDTITFTSVVKNDGGRRAPASKLSFKVGGETNPQVFDVPELEGCEKYRVRRQVLLGVAQRYRNTVVVDVETSVPESNEANNQRIEEYEVVSESP